MKTSSIERGTRGGDRARVKYERCGIEIKMGMSVVQEYCPTHRQRAQETVSQCLVSAEDKQRHLRNYCLFSQLAKICDSLNWILWLIAFNETASSESIITSYNDFHTSREFCSLHLLCKLLQDCTRRRW